MKKSDNLGFFQKIILAISDFRIYPHILKTESLAKSISHFALFMLIIAIIISANYSVKVFEGFDLLLTKYDEYMPEFTLENGVLDLEMQDVIIVQNDLVAIINTDYKYEECTELEQYSGYDRYKNKVFVNSDAITVESLIGSNSAGVLDEIVQEQLTFKDFPVNYTKTTFYENIFELKDSFSIKVMIFFVVFIVMFIAYILWKFFEVFAYAVMAALVAAISGMKLSFKNYIKMAVYIVTLPYILETISIIYIGEIGATAFLVSNILAYVYIFYAVRAVKLDAFLIIINKSGKIQKGKNGGTLISIEPEKDNSKTNVEDKEKSEKDSDNEQENKDAKDDNSKEDNTQK
ncbi:MAG: DUF1189 family protein [Clostridia bacterium]|nr:DUF1189 family protein [Clostridia bacterium]